MPDLLGDALSRVADRYDPPLNPYRHRPEMWVKDKLREHFWSKQVEIAQSVVANRYTACHSSYGTGKSFSGSRIVGWWLDTMPDPFVVTSAPTTSQIGAILWREIRYMHEKGDLAGRTTLDNQWYVGNHLVAFGRKPADYADPEKAKASFQGIHARNVLVVLDEAAGIPKWLWEAVDGLVTNENSRVLAIGNPDDPASEFAKVCSPGSDYNVIHISAFDTPAFTGEAIPSELYDVLVSKLWVDERERKWGKDSPMYVSKVLGQFPELSDDTLITPAMINRAKEIWLPGYELGVYGADIARLGVDRTVVYRNRGGVIRHVAGWGKSDTMRTAGRLKRIIKSTHEAVPMVIDVIGVGAGVYDRLKEQNLPVQAFNAAEKAVLNLHETEDFRNKRSQQWWEVRRMFDDGEIDLDPLDEDLQAQLVSIKWDTDSSGRIFIEPKEKTIKRIGVSPDFADAFMMSTVKADQWVSFVREREAMGYLNKEESITGDLLERPS